MVIYNYDFLTDLLFFQHIQVHRLDFNAWKCSQTCHYIELSEYKLYIGYIHTQVLTREWIARLDQPLSFSRLTEALKKHQKQVLIKASIQEGGGNKDK